MTLAPGESLANADASETGRADFSQLKSLLLEMAERVETLVELSTDAFLDRDSDRADAVLKRDDEIDRMEQTLETLALSLLALQHPVARDLRLVVGVLRVANEIERTADHAVNIAHTVIRSARSAVRAPVPSALPDMIRQSRRMLSHALDAFIRGDAELGRSIGAADRAIDAFHECIDREMRACMLRDPEMIDGALEILSVSRNLERIADLATNIGECAVFLAEGVHILHRGT